MLTQLNYESKVLPMGDGTSKRFRVGLKLKGGDDNIRIVY